MIKNGTQIIYNKKVFFNYQIEEKFEAGIELLGSEVKSLRDARCSIKDAFVMPSSSNELFLNNCNIQEYSFANRMNHDPLRKRKLLLKKRQIQNLCGKISTAGYSLVPISLYFNEKGYVKVELGLGKGKTSIDKRETIKERDWKREKAALLKRNA